MGWPGPGRGPASRRSTAAADFARLVLVAFGAGAFVWGVNQVLDPGRIWYLWIWALLAVVLAARGLKALGALVRRRGAPPDEDE